MITIKDIENEEWFDKWLKNMEKDIPSNFTVGEYVDRMDCETIYDLINHSFTWSHTPEGHGYWSSVAKAIYQDEGGRRNDG